MQKRFWSAEDPWPGQPNVGPSHPALTRMQRQLTLMVESIDPKHTGKDIIQTIKSKVNVTSLGVGVSGVRKCKNSKIAIFVTSEEERKRMGSAIESLGDRFSVTTPRARNPLLRLIDVTPDIKDVKVEETLHKMLVSSPDSLRNKDPSEWLGGLKEGTVRYAILF